MRSSGGGAEFVLESGVARYRALSDQRGSVHVRCLQLALTPPMYRRGFTWKPVDHVHHEDVVLAYLCTKHNSKNISNERFFV